MSDLKHASARGVAWNVFQNLISRLLSLVVVAILGRKLSHADFGAVALASTVVAFGELLVSQGYGDFIAQRPSISKDHLDSAFWLNAALGVGLTAVIVVGADPVSTYLLDEPTLVPIVRLMSLSLLFRSLSVVPTGLLTRDLNFRSLSLRGLVAGVVGGCVGVTTVMLGAGIYALVAQVVVSDLVSMIALWRATTWRPGLQVSRASWRELTKFGSPVFAATVLNFASRRLDSVIYTRVRVPIIGRAGLDELGTYSMAQRNFQIANQVLNKSSDSVVFSALSRITDSDERRRDVIYKVIEVVSVVCFPVYMLLAILAKPFLVALFSARWGDTAPALTMFAISGLPVTLGYINVAAIKAAGRTRIYFMIHIVLALTYVPLMYVMSAYGTEAAANAYLISTIVIMPLEIYLLRKTLQVEVVRYVQALVGPVLGTATMVGTTLLFARTLSSLSPLVQLLAEGLVGMLVYTLALRVLAPSAFRRCVDLIASTLRRKVGTGIVARGS